MKDINLLSEELRDERDPISDKPVSKVSIKVIVIGIAVLAVCAASFALPQVYVSTLQDKVKGMEATLAQPQYLEIQKLNTQVNQSMAKVDGKRNIISNIEKDNVSVEEILTSIKAVTPQGCYITTMNYTKGVITVSGKCTSPMIASEFRNNVDRLGFVNISDALDAIRITKTGTGIYSFSSTISIKGKDVK